MSKADFIHALQRQKSPGGPVLGAGTSIACRDLMQYTGAWFPEAHAAGVDIIGPECAIPLATPLENLRAIRTINKNHCHPITRQNG